MTFTVAIIALAFVLFTYQGIDEERRKGRRE